MKIDQLKQVLEMLDQSSVNELSLETDTYKLKLKKQGETVTVSHQAPAAPVAAPAPVKQAAAPVEEEATADDTVTINALMVGTFYSRPNPDKPAYVKVGDQIEVGQIVCVLEAMKLFNNLNSEVSGTVVEILVADGDLVEFGQPLFRIRP
ncbi:MULTISPECIES: acetyl-CoA carboxylase biotin carboxyl carrier protein [Exiguobacterium]|uniref:Biotin carboxyl carrier protein of acetyl-CoA carboxylase n=1 Tax=Exiguobacterium acetylicum TaxID=41170 RepID=A0ABX8GC23_EXIAC|nr:MULTISPECIES: acetyl-CoA carboxylase biotin carboxyl carrier protein [Exiguobacterium]AOT00042.1 acetyl-CoA carboxylase, biotin carboxyl carrier protein [Exiguobacterium sp. U13-1]MBF8153796.1 acetyl-CoA carboxylase biotin carboxyl carrier protein [Exiguobacterium sp. TBG-PICH-001]OAI87735.1 acetyl-CoA carboxylase, biotin carboxyl carrier protein [Exiguobacterium sp. KKBO11]QWB30996.1 acetyl-CoA carboxylase biotin carboxyl carrier protein [Exiguobacterium acetylicum]HCD60347.1 acetyl-CoA ca